MELVHGFLVLPAGNGDHRFRVLVGRANLSAETARSFARRVGHFFEQAGDGLSVSFRGIEMRHSDKGGVVGHVVTHRLQHRLAPWRAGAQTSPCWPCSAWPS